MDLLKKCESTNEKIISKIMMTLGTEYMRDENSTARIRYTISFLLVELEKFILLLCVFYIFHQLKFFLIAFFTLMSLRVFMGGLHRETVFGCVTHTILMFAIILLSASYIKINVMGEYIVFVVGVFLIWITTPLHSEKRIKYNSSQKMTFKIKALSVMVALALLIRDVSLDNKKVMMSTILVQFLEVGLLYFINKRKEVKTNENIKRKIK